MASAIQNINGFQFSLCFISCDLLDEEHLEFRRVTEDSLGFLCELEKVGANPHKPKKDAEIVDFGQL